MEKLYKKSQGEKASLCLQNNCVTVYGETAKVINALTAIASIVILIALVSKAIR